MHNRIRNIAPVVVVVAVMPLMAALTALTGTENMLRLGLCGDRLRVVTRNQSHTAVSPAESTLEDVFVSLVGG